MDDEKIVMKALACCAAIDPTSYTSIDRARGMAQAALAINRHTHIALYTDGKLTDECAKCGLDLRSQIHHNA